MTASHMQLQQPTLVKPIGLPTAPSRQLFLFDMQQPPTRPPVSPVQKLFPRSNGAKRNLFGAPEPGEIKQICEDDLECKRQNFLKRYNFDIKTEKFINNNNDNEIGDISNNIPPLDETTPSSSSLTASASSAVVATSLTTSSASSLSNIISKEQLKSDNISFNYNIDINIKNENSNDDGIIKNGLNNKTIYNGKKHTSEIKCDEASGNILNNLNNKIDLNNTQIFNNNCNNNHDECDLYSCNQTNNKNNNLLNSEITTNELIINNNNNSRRKLSTSESCSPIKSAKKSNERIKPYSKQTQITDSFAVRKTVIMHTIEKPKPQTAVLYNHHSDILKDGSLVDEKLTIS